ncbi:MAG: hypothetical protein KDI61_09365 [Alphaproteobacteria bacterium]|nr:hypothetical protein [Alphaproteobacteria bacterium]
MGKPFDYVFTVDLYVLDQTSQGAFFETLIEKDIKNYGPELGLGLEYDITSFLKVSCGHFHGYISNSFLRRINNDWDIAEDISDEFDMLFDWEMPDEIYVCDIRRRQANQYGQIFFIPAGKNRFIVSKWLCKNGLLD